MVVWMIIIILVLAFPLWLAVIFGEVTQQYGKFLCAGVIAWAFWLIVLILATKVLGL